MTLNGDKIPSDVDRCPDEPETFNNYQDKDGCPDERKRKVIIKRHTIWTSEAIYFDSDKWHLRPRFRALLKQVARSIKREVVARRIRTVYVEGHADPRGDEKYNQWLSFKRAKNVVRYLYRQGVPRRGFACCGLGCATALGYQRDQKGNGSQSPCAVPYCSTFRKWDGRWR